MQRLSVTSLLLTLLCAAFPNLSRALPGPPPEARTLDRSGTLYYTGTVYVSSFGDTVGLKARGFCIVECEGRSFSSMCYKVEWPKSALEGTTPDFVTGLVYDAPDRRESSRGIDMGGSQFQSVGVSIPYRAGHDAGLPKGSGAPPYDATDTVIASVPYVRGTVLCNSVRDTVDLRRLGFTGFENSAQRFDTLGGRQYLRLNALWPATVKPAELPATVPQIRAKQAEGASSARSSVNIHSGHSPK